MEMLMMYISHLSPSNSEEGTHYTSNFRTACQQIHW